MNILTHIHTDYPASMEQKLHEIFKKYHVHSEWFSIPADWAMSIGEL